MSKNPPKADLSRVVQMPKLPGSSHQDVHLYEDMREGAQMLYQKEAQIKGAARTIEQQFALYRDQIGILRSINASVTTKFVRIKDVSNSVRRNCDNQLKKLNSMKRKAENPLDKQRIEQQIAYIENIKKQAEAIRDNVRVELRNSVRAIRTIMWHI